MNWSLIITTLYPGAQWSLTNNDLSTLRWGGPGEKPTQAELEAGWQNHLNPPPPPPEPITVPSAAFFQAIGRDLEITLKAKINETQDLNQRHYLLKFLEYPYFQSNHPMVAQFGTMLGKTPAQIEGWFKAAEAIAYPKG